jgi:hypothetical protein
MRIRLEWLRIVAEPVGEAFEIVVLCSNSDSTNYLAVVRVQRRKAKWKVNKLSLTKRIDSASPSLRKASRGKRQRRIEPSARDPEARRAPEHIGLARRKSVVFRVIRRKDDRLTLGAKKVAHGIFKIRLKALEIALGQNWGRTINSYVEHCDSVSTFEKGLSKVNTASSRPNDKHSVHRS